MNIYLKIFLKILTHFNNIKYYNIELNILYKFH